MQDAGSCCCCCHCRLFPQRHRRCLVSCRLTPAMRLSLYASCRRRYEACCTTTISLLLQTQHDTTQYALISLHWLRVPERITFKVATLTHHALHGSAPPYLASSFTCVADMPHRRRLRFASTEQLERSDLSSVNCRRSCHSCCWSKGVEWPGKRCYVGLVAVGVQEQAEDILVPPLLRNCLMLMTFPFLVIISLSPEQWSLQ